MPCFCNTSMARLPSLRPQVSADVRMVPPQLEQLAGLLGLQASGGVRADATLAAAVPEMAPDVWMKATLSATVPNMPLPQVLPSGGGPLISMMMRLSAAARVMPLGDPRRLVAELKQMVASMSAQMMPLTAPISAIPQAQYPNMVLAARMTLALRAKGICPMALAGVDLSYSESMQLGEPQSQMRSAISFAAKVKPPRTPKLLISPPQLALAMQLSAMAKLDTAHEAQALPPVSDPNFARMIQAQIAALAQIPAPALPTPPEELLALAAKLDEMATIQEAFGSDAMTPAGMARINAMLNYVARLNLPVPAMQLAVQAQLDALPSIEDIRLGAQNAKTGASALAASLSAKIPDIPILPLIEAIGALSAVMQKATGLSPFGPCDACRFPVQDFG